MYSSTHPVTLSCTAIGTGLSGTWSKGAGLESLSTTNEIKDGRLFVISTVAKESGKYMCMISNNKTSIQSYTMVQLFKSKYDILMIFTE